MRDNTVTTEIPARIGGDAGPLYQYDYGQRLIFTGVELPPEYEVHFSNEENGKSITMIGNSTGVDVPDALLLTGKDIHVWLYLHAGAEDGETAYHVRIRVIKRAQPTHDEPTPVQQDEIEQLIAELIAAVERSESNVLNYPKIVDDEWYVWDAEQSEFVGTGIMAKGQDYVLTEEDKVEIAVLVGEVVGIPTKVSQLENDSGFINEETDPTVPAWAKAENKPTYTKSEVGLGNVMNERQYSAQNPPPHDTTKVDTAMVGRANGVASLDSAGKVPSSQLPSYVDDVVEYPTLNDFPATGESGKIYVDLSTNKSYRWGGSEYVVIASDLALGETSSTAYRGDRGKVAYDHAQAKGNAYASGLYKIATNSEGHVTGATAVAKADIEALGIDEEVIVSDTQPSADGNKVWIDPEADEQFTVPTYTEFSLLSETVSGKYTKPSDGIPASDMASGVIPVVHNVPEGGDEGQVLAKASGNDYDLTWVNHPALTSLIDDTAGQGATARVWSSDKSYSESLLKQAKITASGILKGDGNGVVSAATAGTDYLVSHQDISGKADKSGTVLSTTLSIGRKANTTEGTHSTALGENLTASGTHSVAVNHSNTASGAFSLAAGYGSTASGKGSFVGGLNSNALGETSFAYGQAVTSNSNGMTAFGVYNTNATLFPDWTANTSYAVGDKVKTSNGIGYRCKTANSDSTFTESKWTKLFTNGDTAFVVGNSVAMDTSSNAMKVDWSGNGYFNGNLYVNCAGDSTGGTKVATEAVVETVTGSTPSITGVDNHRYKCGTVSTISVTPPQNGVIDVVFTSGSTAAVLTAAGVNWPSWFNPSNLSTNTTYEINIMDGVLGAVMKWT